MTAAPSVRHEHRQFGLGQDLRGCAAKDHLTQARIGVGAFDEQVRAERCCLGEKGNSMRQFPRWKYERQAPGVSDLNSASYSRLKLRSPS